MDTASASSRTPSLSFIRTFRGTFHMMFCRLNWSSHAMVMLPPMPSLWPAVWSVRFPPPKKNPIGIMVSPHLDAGDRVRPRLPGTLERCDRVPHRLHRGLKSLRVRRRLADHRDDARGSVKGVEHRVVVFVELVELRLLDLDRRAEAGIAAFRMADLRLEPFDREDRVPDRLQALDLAVHRHLVSDVLEVPADAFQLVRELDPEEVVGRADVFPSSIPSVPGDHELDLLQQSAVLFDSVTDVGHRSSLRAFRHIMFRTYLFRGMDGSPQVRTHQRANAGRSPFMPSPEPPSMRLIICWPLCAYSMNHTGAWSSSPSYVVG